MMRKLIVILARISTRLRIARDPIGYARSIGVQIGERVTFYGMDPSMFGSEPWLVTIGSDVFVTAGVQFITHDGGTLILRGEVPDLEWTAPITIGNSVYLGLRAMVLPGVTIGDRCIIGAGAVVSRSIPSGSVAVGVPARVIGTTDDYLRRMCAKSLKLGHLRGAEKDAALRRHFQAQAHGPARSRSELS
jgi:acetyltransferase-like isoleucine patch superfamily enzyme